MSSFCETCWWTRSKRRTSGSFSHEYTNRETCLRVGLDSRCCFLSPDGRWGFVCGNNWDFDDAVVVCRQLGYSRALEAVTGLFQNGSTIDYFYYLWYFRRTWVLPIWIDKVDCQGNEKGIEERPFCFDTMCCIFLRISFVLTEL